MDKTEAAFRWIHQQLTERNIPFVVGGGFAVRLFGGSRPIYDIDLDIPEDRFKDLLPAVQPYIVEGPQRFKDELFDVVLLTLDYQGQLIDITGAESIRIFDKKEQRWRDDPTDFQAVETREAYELPVQVQRPDLLVRYKRWIARPTDLQDVEELERLLGKLSR
jgi:hypothetical protein